MVFCEDTMILKMQSAQYTGLPNIYCPVIVSYFVVLIDILGLLYFYLWVFQYSVILMNFDISRHSWFGREKDISYHKEKKNHALSVWDIYFLGHLQLVGFPHMADNLQASLKKILIGIWFIKQTTDAKHQISQCCQTYNKVLFPPFIWGPRKTQGGTGPNWIEKMLSLCWLKLWFWGKIPSLILASFHFTSHSQSWHLILCTWRWSTVFPGPLQLFKTRPCLI